MESLLTKIGVTVFLMSISCIISWSAVASSTISTDQEVLKVHFIDIGDGDSILIDFGELEILIDGGYPDSGVAEYIAEYVDGALEAVVNTHPHPDHVGGLIPVLERFDVKEIWINGDTPPAILNMDSLMKQFDEMVKQEGAPVHIARRGQTIQVGTLSLDVLHPSKLFAPSDLQDFMSVAVAMNNSSLVLKLQYGDIAFLFTGDALKEAEAEMLAAGLDVRADVLKLGAHGANTASSSEFLKHVNPKIAVYIGSGKAKRGPLRPNPTTIARLKEMGISVYGSNIHGTTIVETDGTIFSVNTEK